MVSMLATIMPRGSSVQTCHMCSIVWTCLMSEWQWK